MKNYYSMDGGSAVSTREIKFSPAEARAIGRRLQEAMDRTSPPMNRSSLARALGVKPQSVDRMLAGGGSMAGWAKAARILKSSLDHLLLGIEIDPELQELVHRLSGRIK